MGNYIIVKRTAKCCWNVYLGDSNGIKSERSLTDVYFSEEEARGRAAYLLAFNQVDGVLKFDDERVEVDEV